MLQNNRQKDKMKVVVRVRPLSNKQNQSIQIYEQFLEGKKKNSKIKLTPQTISFFSKYRHANVRQILRINQNYISVYDQQYKNSQTKMRDFNFSNVFEQHISNEQIFENTVKQGINGVIEGYNCTILAYGITGSGKTFSVFGHPKIDKDKGICFLAYQYILAKKQEMEKNNAIVDIKFSFLQIYNENIRDLLSDDIKKQVFINQDAKGNTQLLDANQIQIKSIEQIVELISSGTSRRASAATVSNQISSRSHAILKLNVQVTRDKQKTTSKLFIIDLAGSQKLNNENSLRKTEGININKSLLTLGNCINALVQSTKKSSLSHIPFRDSKLTRLLKDSLGGNTKIIMIACISPSPFTLEQTITTLNYAERAKGIKKEITKNIVNSQSQCPRCRCEINLLKVAPLTLQSQHQLHEQINETQTISNDLLERLYNDIIENARQLQKLQGLKSLMNEPCEQFDAVYTANQSQKILLKDTLMNLLQHNKFNVNKIQEEQNSKPQKKKIRLLNSSRKQSRDKQKVKEQDKENIKNGQEIRPQNYIPQYQQRQEKLKTQQNYLPIKRKRSKVEIIKKPPIYQSKRSCSERAITQY